MVILNLGICGEQISQAISEAEVTHFSPLGLWNASGDNSANC
jgi:hypothetical protein